jgi:Tfp pilus assembly protein PilW
MRRLLDNERGYSLGELLVVTAVLGLILGAVFTIQQQGQQSYVMGSNRVEAQQNTRVALELMTRELRTAQGMVTLGGSSDLTFLDQNNVQIQYQVSGTTLNRISDGTTNAVIGGVVSLTMTYCKVWDAVANSCTTTAATPADVNVIRLQLVARTEESVATGSLGDRRMTAESTVRLRNVNI